MQSNSDLFPKALCLYDAEIRLWTLLKYLLPVQGIIVVSPESGQQSEAILGYIDLHEMKIGDGG